MRQRADELERRLQARLDALGPAPRAELLRVLMLPDLERADRIGEFWGNPKTRTFAEPLIDCERTGSFGRSSSGCCGRPSASSVTEAMGAPIAGPHGEPGAS